MTAKENPGALAGATGVNKGDQLSTPVVERHTACVRATQPPPVFAGVDIGLEGAIAVLTAEGALIDVVDMPCLAAGAAGRRALNAPLVADILAKTHASHAFVELVGARPGEGPAGAFSFGKSLGMIEGVLAALSIPQTLTTPAVWKRTIGIPPGKEGAKDRARAEAIRRWPSKAALFARKRDDGRAESALIAVAGMLREKRL
jgi:crossover junction endodeoxyribonuclease RuvC